MPATSSTRQSFPRWRIERGEPEPTPAARGAKVIPFPAAAMRRRSVVTYPAALVVPVRKEGAAGPLASQGRAHVLGTAVVLAMLGWALAALS